MKIFENFRGGILPLDRANVDTDAIIPKQYLKSIKRTGFEGALFSDWRYLPDGKPDPSFVLNKEEYRNATILLARNNFGCGSSREHAVWAIVQYGFRAVIAPWAGEGKSRVPGFADIFRNNSVKNGLLTIELSPADVDMIFSFAEKESLLEATVHLVDQTVTVHAGDRDHVFRFEIDPSVKDRFLRGLDDIGITLQHESAISAFEKKHNPLLSLKQISR
ncbi:MAG TPA: 3-isopropylmalate dehydratase small subunit [Candidatus Omnitrophota bacterium]|jgi:3-isopropylmalate/(R)-2-methylmalate dehydratase small subunit|nr:3-isopropylmalate dehydratase small subunit [Candidatus Omnitrophota bacterium]HQB94959.1 3-isopropylmalate dehydratase small subunit [Candidatus Omnitrophota bacterium]